jgi:hypothetical protein
MGLAKQFRVVGACQTKLSGRKHVMAQGAQKSEGYGVNILVG